MKSKLLKRIKYVLGVDKWEVRRTIWPYIDGWGVYCPSTRTILEHGLSKERAQEICDEMNGLEHTSLHL